MMGGQMDIDIITSCRLIDVKYPKCVEDKFLGPQIGIKWYARVCGQHDKPLFGSIIKPKIGLSVDGLLDMTKQLVDGELILSEKIMSNPSFCS